MKTLWSLALILALTSIFSAQSAHSNKKEKTVKWMGIASNIHKQHKTPALMGKKFYKITHNTSTAHLYGLDDILPSEARGSKQLDLPSDIQTITGKITTTLNNNALKNTFYLSALMIPLTNIILQPTITSLFSNSVTLGVGIEYWWNWSSNKKSELSQDYKKLGEKIIDLLAKNKQNKKENNIQ